jgi:hypothetical protein
MSEWPRARHWRHGDVVTHAFGDVVITGKVVVLRRRADNAPFKMVQITGGARVGTRVFPHDGWVLGSGSREATCLECQQPFRTNEPKAEFCQACDRDKPSHGPDDIRKPLAFMYGARTPRPAARERTPEELVEIEEQRRRDAEESIL